MKKITLAVLLATVFLTGNVFADAINLNRPLVLGLSGEPSLTAIFSTEYVSGGTGAINGYSGQSSIALWTESENDVSGYAVTKYSSATGTLGIYSAANGTIHLLDFGSQGKVSFDIKSDGSVSIDDATGFHTYANFGQAFGFVYSSTTGVSSFTEDSKNSGGYGKDGNILALTYLVPDGYKFFAPIYGDTLSGKGNDDWFLAFEDTLKTLGGDGDFNDALYFIEDMQAVPETATMLLLGAGLLGLAAYGRKRLV